MELKELIKKLVETEDQMERMALVEENNAIIEESGPAENTDYKKKYEDLKIKYIETFFSGDEKKETKQKEKEEEEEENEAEKITIEDLFKEGEN